MRVTLSRNLWSSLSLIGIRNSDDYSDTRTKILNNQLSATLIGLLVVLTALFYITVPNNSTITNWLFGLTAFLVLSLYLNSLGLFKVNQFILSIGLTLFVLGATIHSKLGNPHLIHEGSYYNPRFFMIGLSFIPFVVFSIKDRMLWVSVVFNLSLLLGYNHIHEWVGASPEAITNQEIKSYTFITFASSFSSLAIVISLYFLKSINTNYEEKIEQLLHKTREAKEEIDASIRYARRLQERVTGNSTGVVTLGLHTSCLSLPKDTLSGDFYFYQRSSDHEYTLSVADCTGHGVPGAFLSALASRTLTRAAIENPGDVGSAFTLINRSFCEDLNGTSMHGIQDGMDVSLAHVDVRSGVISLANARSYAILMSNGEVAELQSERHSIGEDAEQQFHSASYSYSESDLLVLFTDGFCDQFGGPNSKKYGRKRLRSFLARHSQYSASELAHALSREFKDWKGSEEQTDDICILIHRLHRDLA